MKDMNMTFDLVLGTLWLSRHEIASMKGGMMVRTNRIAGTGFELHLGGKRIADIDAMPVDLSGGKSRLCARIRSLSAQSYPEPEPFRGNALCELLPCSVVLGSFSATAADMEGIGWMSVIDASIEAKTEQGCTLMAAGIPLARGIVYVIGENMGMRITEVLARPERNMPFRTTGFLLEESWKDEKTCAYDFKRPDCFTRNQLVRIEAIHRDFSRALAAIPGTGLAQPTISLVDQLNLTEFLDMVDKDIRVFAVPAAARISRIDESGGELPVRVFHAGDSTGFPDADVLALMERERAKPSGGSILVCGSAFEKNADAITTALRDAWKNYGSLSPQSPREIGRMKDIRWEKGKSACGLSAYADEYEMIVLVSFSLAPSADTLHVVYPLRVLESVLKALAL